MSKERINKAQGRRKRLLKWPEAVLLLLIAASLCYQLFFPPIIGVADNEDYFRLFHPLGLSHSLEEYEECCHGYVNRHYSIGDPKPIELFSTQLIPAKIALTLDKLFTRDAIFDLTMLGGVNVFLYLCGLYLILLGTGTCSGPFRVASGLLILFAAVDVEYIAYFNSFYSEPGALIFLVLIVGLSMGFIRRNWPPLPATVGFFLAAALLIGMKPQYYFLAPPLLLVPLSWTRRPVKPADRRLVLGLGLVLVLFGGYLYSKTPYAFKRYNLWNSLFYTILAESPDPGRDLVELGLDPKLAGYAGRPAYAPDTPVFETTENYNFWTLIRFYARHPGRFLSVAAVCARHTFVSLNDDNGNFERSAGREWNARSEDFNSWHTFQKIFFPKSIFFLSALIFLLVLVIWRTFERHGLGSPEGLSGALLGTLGLLAICHYGICMIGDGKYEIGKHLFLFYALFDACFIAGTAYAFSSLCRVLNRMWAREPERHPFLR